MLTNGPAATNDEMLTVPLVCPRNRLLLAGDADSMPKRQAVIDFLCARHQQAAEAAEAAEASSSGVHPGVAASRIR